jgi:hypothetical protein
MNKLQRLARPMLDTPPHPLPDLATLERRVRQRARRRQGTRTLAAAIGVLLLATALFRPVATDTALSAGGAPAGTATGSTGMPGSVPGSVPGSASASASAGDPVPGPVPPPPPEPQGDPVVEVRFDPPAAPADALRTMTFVNRSGAPLVTCALGFRRWLGSGWEDPIALGLMPQGTVLMGPSDSDILCPDGARRLTVAVGGTATLTERFGDRIDRPPVNPPLLRPGVYRVTKVRHDDPELVGQFTVTGN